MFDIGDRVIRKKFGCAGFVVDIRQQGLCAGRYYDVMWDDNDKIGIYFTYDELALYTYEDFQDKIVDRLEGANNGS